MSDKNKFPEGWDENRVQELLGHYESQSPDEAIAEDEALSELEGYTMMEVPTGLVPEVRRLIADKERSA